MNERQEPENTSAGQDASAQPWWARPENGAPSEGGQAPGNGEQPTTPQPMTPQPSTPLSAGAAPATGADGANGRYPAAYPSSWGAPGTQPGYGSEPHEPYLPGGSATYPGAPTMVIDQDAATSRKQRRSLGLAAGLVALIVISAAASGTVVHLVDDNHKSGTTTTTIQTAAGAAPTSAASGDVHSALATISPSVVIINTVIGGSSSSTFGGGFGNGSQSGETGTAAGTGIITSADGIIVTNAHVVADATSIKVTLSDGKTATATVLGANTTKDLAAIKITGFTNLTPAVFAKTATVQVGNQVIAVGNAEGYGGAPSVSEGIVSALGRTLPGNTSTLTGLIQTDAAINPGNSGGPLVDTAGHVIGIDTAIATGTSTEPAVNIGFAIPSDAITAELPALIAGQSTQTAYLGVQLADTGPAVVGAVGQGSPASDAGLQAGDTITKIDGKAISNSSDAVGVIGSDKPGQKITITVQGADGTSQQLQATLTTKPTTD